MLLGKNYDNAFQFSKVIRQNIVLPFTEVVCDSAVCNDVAITSSLRIGDNIRKEISIFLLK